MIPWLALTGLGFTIIGIVGAIICGVWLERNLLDDRLRWRLMWFLMLFCILFTLAGLGMMTTGSPR